MHVMFSLQTAQCLPWWRAQKHMPSSRFSADLFRLFFHQYVCFGFRWGSWRAPMNTWVWREQEEARRCWWVIAHTHIHTNTHIPMHLKFRPYATPVFLKQERAASQHMYTTMTVTDSLALPTSLLLVSIVYVTGTIAGSSQNNSKLSLLLSRCILSLVSNVLSWLCKYGQYNILSINVLYKLTITNNSSSHLQIMCYMKN